MTRTNGKAYIEVGKLEENRISISGILSEITENKASIRSEMSALFDNYESPNNSIIRVKSNQIDDSINTFIVGESKVPRILLPDVNRRFHKGASITREKAAETKSINNADLKPINRIVESSFVDDYSKMVANQEFSKAKRSDDFKDTKGFVPTAVEFDVVKYEKGIDQVSSDFSNLSIDKKETISVFYTTISQSNGFLRVDLKYQINDGERTSQYSAAKLTFPANGNVKNVVVDLTKSSSTNEAKFLETKREENVVVTPEVINFQAIAKLAIVIKDNPVEFLNSVVVNQSNGLVLDVKLLDAPELEMVLDSSDDSNLDFLLKDSDLVAQFDSIFIEDSSKLGDFENLPNVQSFNSEVDFSGDSNLDI